MKIKLLALSLFTFFIIFCAQAQDSTFVYNSQALLERTESLEKEIAILKKLSISGYVQAQYEWGEGLASLRVGSKNENPDKSFNRIGIRRGRIKFTYTEKLISGVFQLDITEKGVGLKDVYINLKDPWFKTNQLRAGVFDRPFGYEISHSSSRRESPERSAMFRALFPDERDLGAMLILQPNITSPLSFLKLEAGLFAGNGINKETDNRRDFIGHLSAQKELNKNASFGAGISYYNGSVYQSTTTVYKMQGKEFVAFYDPSNHGGYAKREYLGVDARFSINTLLGKTELRSEYIFGQQPGTAYSNESPNSSSIIVTSTYIRDFKGMYVMFIQKIGNYPFAAVLKYDWYDPNTKVKKDDIGQHETTYADISKQALGIGGIWDINTHLCLQAYYEFNYNEKTKFIEGWEEDRADDSFTLRLQYKF